MEDWPHSGESLEDIPEMRPGTDPWDDWYSVKDLRDNRDRAYLGLPDWQADVPVYPFPAKPHPVHRLR